MKSAIRFSIALACAIAALIFPPVAATGAEKARTTPLMDFLPGTTWVPLIASRSNWEAVTFTADGKVIRTLRGGKEDGGMSFSIEKDEILAHWSNGNVAWRMKVAANRKTLEYDNAKFKLAGK